ncbi:MAG: queuosine precursor transporter [Phycisphaerales bacterium]|nr:queuosine precursor transporter [Phycisphaerales bacterium]
MPPPPHPPSSATPAAITAQTTFTTAQRVYLWLTALSVAALLIADITGVKLFSFNLWGITVKHSCGMLTFPITFVLTDLVNEYYGRRAARRIVWIGFAMGAFVWFVVRTTLWMPRWEVPFNVAPDAFEAVFQSSQIMYFASLLAYLTGSMCDIAIFGRLKRLTGGKMVWLRATGSTVVSQMLDSLVVTFFGLSYGRMVFGGGDPMPIESVPQTAATGYILKFFIALALTPLIYAGRALMQRRFGLVPLPSDHV